MRRVVLVGAGFVLTLAGVVFTLQGLGILGGSVMSGSTFWAVAARSSRWRAWSWRPSACATGRPPR